MSQDSPTFENLQAEVAGLKQELQARDLLVQQLSQELFRLVKGNTGFLPSPEVSEKHLAEMKVLREQLARVEEQLEFYQNQIANRDEEIQALRRSVQELTDRSRTLEQVVQDLPEVYRRKFAERMVPVREKVAAIQKENRQLYAELQSVSYRLAVRSRRSGRVELPNFLQQGDSVELPTASQG
ncbi:Npun_F5560 family protein [Leptolyngbya sp. FACHB-261]|uniref:Npun_F5560 family protein n=1 Tax=Leptolyngbya sp. FACHB-261 TaxID=2692806 RepID=UPI001682E839|nr:Npun_F5560 family protein [Leptolyngbya sp. FACHB-261]MBD2103793.1 hypothetical protein [Leptolyngbya sp. FACHB-261]